MNIINPVTNTVTTATQLLLANIGKYHLNPSSVQQDILDVLELGLAGNDIVDVTNPFIFLMEASATATAAAISESQTITRALYPELAMTKGELYHHMSDTDYIGIFATAASSTVNMLIPYQLLQNVAVFLNNSTEVKSVIFPRDTKISFNGTDLAIGYPIQINLLAYNVVQVMYDTTIDNPLMPLTTNVLIDNIVDYQNTQYLQIAVPVKQYAATSTIFVLSNLASFTQTIPFANSFYYARAFVNTGTGVWVEIKTTHTPIVYDITKPTLLLSVTDNLLTIALPDIYQSLNMAGTSIRVDLYSTLGKLDIDLSQVTSASYSGTWNDFNTLVKNPGTAPLSKLNDIIFFSTNLLSGGSDAASLDEMRERVIYHVNSTVAPVRLSDLEVGLNMYGYVTQKVIDSVTDRVFLSSKNLPMRNIKGLLTTPLATNTNVLFNTAHGLDSGLYQKSIRTQIISRATIMPETIYAIIDGNLSFLADSELLALQGLSAVQLCETLNTNLYMYSPFHYVIDYTQPMVTARPYYLAAPTIQRRTFIAANTIRSYNINTVNATIALVDNNYILVLSTSIPSGITGVICQLSYRDAASRTTLFLTSTATILASTATFTFTLNTNFDISQLDELEIMNMTNSLNINSPMFINIASDFNIFYLVTGNNAGLETSFDNLYHTDVQQGTVIGATYETISIRFGQSLPSLFCPVRSILTTGTYVTYTQNIYATYLETVYQTGPLGKLYDINADGSIEFLVLHAVGDVIEDAAGDSVILHKVGDNILDASGNLIPTQNYINSIVQQVGITMIDAKYKFATTATTKKYTGAIPDNIIGFLTNELAPSAGLLNERTQLFYKPMGEPTVVNVLTGNGITALVPGILDIQITYYVTQEGLKNETILALIRTLTRTILSTVIALPTISVAGLTSALTKANPKQVVGFSIDKFLPNNAPLVTLVDPGTAFVIGEELIVLPDGSLEVNDKVTILFKSAT